MAKVICIRNYGNELTKYSVYECDDEHNSLITNNNGDKVWYRLDYFKVLDWVECMAMRDYENGCKNGYATLSTVSSLFEYCDRVGDMYDQKEKEWKQWLFDNSKSI